MTSFWDIAPCSSVEVHRRFRNSYDLNHQAATMMDEASGYKTSVNFKTTQRNIPEGYRL
jgi:hypothetical protein